MSGIHFIQGDATAPVGEGPYLIAHVCNDLGAWGRGFTAALSRRWPGVEAAFRRAFPNGGGLGAVQFVPVEPALVVANMVAQHGLRSRSNAVPLSYPALRNALGAVGSYARMPSFRTSVHMPRIGCGLAGGRWEQVQPMIETALFGLDVYVYDLPTADVLA